MRSAVLLALAVTCFAVLRSASGRRNVGAYCGGKELALWSIPDVDCLHVVLCLFPACKAIVDELSYEVKKVDRKKTIQVSCQCYA